MRTAFAGADDAAPTYISLAVDAKAVAVTAVTLIEMLPDRSPEPEPVALPVSENVREADSLPALVALVAVVALPDSAT